MGTKKTTTTKKAFSNAFTCQCEHACHTDKAKRSPAGNPGHRYGQIFALSAERRVRTAWGTFLVCYDCAKDCLADQALIPVSKWFNENVDSHSVYEHQEMARRFFQATGQLADWPTATYKETVQSMRNDPRGGTLERGLKNQLVCYGWIMARHMARKLVHHESHMMGRGFEFHDCVEALAKGGF